MQQLQACHAGRIPGGRAHAEASGAVDGDGLTGHGIAADREHEGRSVGEAGAPGRQGGKLAGPAGEHGAASRGRRVPTVRPRPRGRLQ